MSKNHLIILLLFILLLSGYLNFYFKNKIENYLIDIKDKNEIIDELKIKIETAKNENKVDKDYLINYDFSNIDSSASSSNSFEINDFKSQNEDDFENCLRRYLSFTIRNKEYINATEIDEYTIKDLGVFVIDEYRIPLSNVKANYINGYELSQTDAVLKDFANSHLVSITCDYGVNCILNEKGQNKFTLSVIQPLKNKEECYELISIVNEFKRILNEIKD